MQIFHLKMNIMEKTIDKRIEHLEQVIQTLKSCTQPVDGHTDPGSITDCWNEVDDYIAAIASAAKKNVFDTWIACIDRQNGENHLTYDDMARQLGTNELYYLPKDNTL